jgi:hypothetical protein
VSYFGVFILYILRCIRLLAATKRRFENANIRNIFDIYKNICSFSVVFFGAAVCKFVSLTADAVFFALVQSAEPQPSRAIISYSALYMT